MADLSKLPLTAHDFKVYKTGDLPRLRDVRFAQRLGFADRLDRIRMIVTRHHARLERLDTLPRYEAKSTGGRPATGYLLTLRQAFFIAAKSEAENADEVLMELSIIGAARYTGEDITADATPLLDKIAAPAAQPTIERNDNVLHVRHDEWPTQQPELFDDGLPATRAPDVAPISTNEIHLRAIIGKGESPNYQADLEKVFKDDPQQQMVFNIGVESTRTVACGRLQRQRSHHYRDESGRSFTSRRYLWEDGGLAELWLFPAVWNSIGMVHTWLTDKSNGKPFCVHHNVTVPLAAAQHLLARECGLSPQIVADVLRLFAWK